MKALGTNIIVKPIIVEKTEGGIIIPTQNSADDIQEGIVTSVGDGTYVGGKATMNVTEGESIFFRASKGMPINKEGEMFKLINITDVLFKS